MFRPSSTRPSATATPAPSSPPPPSESFLSELDGTAPSALGTGSVRDFAPAAPKVDPTSLNLVSWKLDVNARAEDGVEKRGFNAISTVLNHPTKRANPLRPSRKPLPPIPPPPPLPRPLQASHYDAYLKTVTPLYETFLRSQSEVNALRTSSLPSDDPVPSSSLEAGVENDAKTGLPPLDTVPQAFFDPDFDLSNPSTWASIIDEPIAGPSTGSRQDMQESLSGHLDTLERHLVHEITLRSSSFFSALSNLQDLHSESASCLEKITELQQSLRDVGVNQAQKGLDVIDAEEQLIVLDAAQAGVRKLGELEDLTKMAKGLVEAGDWAGGLACLRDLAVWWQKYGLSTTEVSEDIELPLSTLPALATLPQMVSQLMTTISSQLEEAISNSLLSVLSSADDGKEFDVSQFKTSLEPMVTAMISCGKSSSLEDVWREVTTTSIREGSRKHLPVSHSEEDGDEEGRPPEARGVNLAEALKAMDHSQFLLLSAQIFTTLLARLRRGKAVGEVLKEILSESEPSTLLQISSFVPESSIASPHTDKPSIDTDDVLASACELANNRSSKILAVRSEQHATLSLEEFVELFKEHWDFVLDTEKLASRMIVALRAVTASQARAFLISYHSIRLTKSANLVQEEQWTQVDVSSHTQHVVDLLVEAAVSDPTECHIPPREPITNGNSNGDAAAVSKSLNVEDKSFFVVKATAETLVLLGDYLKIVINLELVVTDVMSRIIEYLKSFNSRTCQVVLGAGAMRSAGLKNITAKHLALASQSLSVVVALIPYIREFIRRHLSPKQAVMLTEFDKLKRDYQEHQNEIHAKLVAIMSDRLAVHIGSLREINWETKPERDGPNGYAEMLVKETATLHKVLSKYLANQTVDSVLSEVLASIVKRLSEEYSKIELKSDEAKKRMTQDATLINTRLSPLCETGKDTASLVALVKDKPTPRRAIGQAMKGMMSRVNSTSLPKSASSGTLDAEATEGLERKSGEEDEDGPAVADQVPPAEAVETLTSTQGMIDNEAGGQIDQSQQAQDGGSVPEMDTQLGDKIEGTDTSAAVEVVPHEDKREERGEDTQESHGRSASNVVDSVDVESEVPAPDVPAKENEIVNPPVPPKAGSE